MTTSSSAAQGSGDDLRNTSKIDEFKAEHGDRLMAFLDRNGYSAREVRAIAAMAIALWATQEM